MVIYGNLFESGQRPEGAIGFSLSDARVPPLVALRVGRRFLEKRYRQSTRALQELAGDLPSRPSPDQIHDLRVTARRIQTMYRLLPGKVRRSQAFKKFGLSLRSVMKATTQLRDLDTLMDTLKSHRGDLPAEFLVTLENQRSDAAAQARVATGVLAQVPAPRLDASLIRSKKLSMKLRKRLRRSRKVSAGLLTEVVDDETKVEELHALRKEGKKMRYLLELSDGRPSELSILTGWQDSLGAIHDLDVAVSYLEGSRKESKRDVILELRRARDARYQKFVREHGKKSIEASGKGRPLAAHPAHP
jgi:CHAD domain-containing protein